MSDIRKEYGENKQSKQDNQNEFARMEFRIGMISQGECPQCLAALGDHGYICWNCNHNVGEEISDYYEWLDRNTDTCPM